MSLLVGETSVARSASGPPLLVAASSPAPRGWPSGRRSTARAEGPAQRGLVVPSRVCSTTHRNLVIRCGLVYAHIWWNRRGFREILYERGSWTNPLTSTRRCMRTARRRQSAAAAATAALAAPPPCHQSKALRIAMPCRGGRRGGARDTPRRPPPHPPTASQGVPWRPRHLDPPRRCRLGAA